LTTGFAVELLPDVTLVPLVELLVWPVDPVVKLPTYVELPVYFESVPVELLADVEFPEEVELAP